MKISLRYLAIFTVLAIPGTLFSQTTVSNDLTINEVISEYLLGEGIEAFNITYNGLGANQVEPRVGTFEVVGPMFPIEAGLLMTTKQVGVATCGPTTDGSGAGFDPDLEQLLDGSGYTVDVTVVEFDFVPQGDAVSFNYIFASTEYHNYVCSQFNDVFGFFLSGPGISGPFTNDAINIATLPNGSPVSINTVNNGGSASGESCSMPGANEPCPCNSEYFIDNGGFSGTGLASDICFGGFTVPLTARAAVQCGNVYHIKLAISNVSDGSLDSGVFL